MGTVHKLLRSDRPRKTTSRDDRLVARLARKHTFAH